MMSIIQSLIVSTILIVYPQNMCINSGLSVENKISIKDINIKNNYKYLNENIIIPQIESSTNSEKYMNINSLIKNNIINKMNENEQISKEYFENLDVKLSYPYEINSQYNIGLNNNGLISMYIDYYEFMGGAHGITTRYSYTLDKNQGKLLKLKDLFYDNYEYKKIINNEIKKYIKREPEKYFDNGDIFKGISDEQSYYFDDDNLVVYYQLYEIAPYVSGIPEFRIPIKLFADNFKYKI